MNVEKRSVLISLLSNLFHYYAFSVYAFSAVILSPIFFHTESYELTKMLGLVTFSVTFFLKPLGSVVFGHIGDKYGRKAALIRSLAAITIATTSIGLIPPHSQAGWVSGFLLIACLFVQGLCIGGQYTGALVYIQEHTKKENAAFACGLVGAIGVFGALLGTATSYLFDHFSEIEWAWRVPFLLSSFVGMALLFLMKKMEETPIFAQNKKQVQLKQVPLMDILKNYKRPFFSAIFISSVPISLFYVATVYIPNFYIEQASVGKSFDPLSLVCVTLVFCIILMPSLGFVGDKLGRERQLKLTSLLLTIFSVFVFYFMYHLNTISGFVLGISFFVVCSSLYTGPGPAYLSEKFPVVGRYSGMGLGIGIGEALFGGLSPMICVGLEQFFESKIAPAYFVVFLGIIGFVGVILSSQSSLFGKKRGMRSSPNDSFPEKAHT